MTVRTEILTDAFLDEIAGKYDDKQSMLTRMAHQREDALPKIKQLRKMWEQLPEHLKANTQLYNHLHSVKEGNFRGGISELVSAWILIQYFDSVVMEVPVGGLTPDFYCEKGEFSYIFETYSLGPTYDERTTARNVVKFKEEISELKSKYRLFLKGGPIPNTEGKFDGLKDEIGQFLAGLTNPTDEVYRVSKDGAEVFFYIYETDEEAPVYVGMLGHIQHGDKGADGLQEQITKKKEKYPFPHIHICVVDSGLVADEDSAVKTLVGNPVIHFDQETFKQVGSGYSNDGFWGIKNSELLNNLHVQAIVLVVQKHLDNGEFELRVSIAENFHLRCGIPSVFSDIPNLFQVADKSERKVFNP